MKDFTQKLPFVITFLVSALLLQLFAGEKITYQFLLLVLFSMIVVNADKMKSFLGRIAAYGK